MRSIVFFFCLLLFTARPVAGQVIDWDTLAPGLEFGQVKAPKTPVVADGMISILRICPDQFGFKLVCATEKDSRRRTAAQWAKEEGLVATINTGMFGMDGLTSVGFMQNYDHVNQPRENKDNTIIAFNPKSATLPDFQIIDKSCQDWPSLKTQYNSMAQGIRMVDCRQKNVWSQQPRIWSMVVMGQDDAGNALFIFTRSPWSVHDFIDMLQALPLRLRKAQYLEGGPEASFFIQFGDFRRDFFGSYETGFYESDDNRQAWPIPNVIGIVPKNR